MRDMDRVRVRITVRVKVRVTNRFRLRLTARDCRYCKPYRPIIMVPTAYRYCIQEIFNMAIESHETESWTLNSRITISYCVSLIIYLSMICERLMLYVRLASPVAVCIAIRCRYTRLAWLANPNPNPNPNPTSPSYGYTRVYTASRV